MKDKYKITEEEINQTILHSPYSLADSPTEAGLRAKQIKKYFYEFIRFFANKVNIHLEDLGETLSNYDELNWAMEVAQDDILLIGEKLLSAQKRDIELGDSIVNQIAAHNESTNVHPALREKLGEDISAHNESRKSHNDIRERLKEAIDKLEVTYSLASGKSRVFPCEDLIDVLDTIDTRTLNVGDLLLVADSSLPDFTVFETGLSEAPGTIMELDYNKVASGEAIFTVGKHYYYNGVRLASTQGTLETNLLAKNEDLEALEDEFFTNRDEVSQALKKISSSLENKEEKLIKSETTASEIPLVSHKEYDLGLITSLFIKIPESTEGLETIVNFRTGATAPLINVPNELIFSGDDCYEGRFYPITNRLYEINIKEVLGVLVAKVGSCDYEVIE